MWAPQHCQWCPSSMPSSSHVSERSVLMRLQRPQAATNLRPEAVSQTGKSNTQSRQPSPSMKIKKKPSARLNPYRSQPTPAAQEQGAVEPLCGSLQTCSFPKLEIQHAIAGLARKDQDKGGPTMVLSCRGVGFCN